MDPLNELKAAFLEECDELLGSLEGRLSAMRDGSVSADDVNGAFRAIHSVKGGAGAFGFAALVELAHVFEAALDHLRAGRVSLNAAPYDLFLRALDAVAGLVSAAKAGAEASAPPDLVRELQRVHGAEASPPTEATSAPPQARAAEARAAGVVRISLRPHGDLFRRAGDLRHVFASLEAFGNVTVRTRLEALPPLASLNAMECHLTCDVAVETEAAASRIAEAIELHLDTDEFELETQDARPPPPPPSPQKAEAPPPAPAKLQSVPPPPASSVRDKQKAAGSIRVDLE
jgi:two-component system, chemotaxis family, sensor kinase CheA